MRNAVKFAAGFTVAYIYTMIGGRLAHQVMEALDAYWAAKDEAKARLNNDKVKVTV